MGRIFLGGSAVADRAFVCDRAYGLGPTGFNPFRMLLGDCCADPRRRAAPGKCLSSRATALPSCRRVRSPLVRLASHGGPRCGAGIRFPGPVSVLDCSSKPPIAAQSLNGGRLRPATMQPSPATSHANRRDLRHILADETGCGNAQSRNPGCHAPLLQPETPSLPCGAFPARRFLRRLRRAKHIKKRRTRMARKTTNTTNNAGPSPAPREAHQRARRDEGPYFEILDGIPLEQAVARLARYIRKNAVPLNGRNST